jgi:hypothetical protein
VRGHTDAQPRYLNNNLHTPRHLLITLYLTTQLPQQHSHPSHSASPTMEQSTNTFIYQPLQTSPQQFRLASIQPGPFSSPINCTLHYANLKDSPPFEALSYVWGDAQDTLPIFLDGHVFNVTTNLESALRHLRWEDTARTFWIDAICINQHDAQERGHQVMFMGEFYRAAEQTTV